MVSCRSTTSSKVSRLEHQVQQEVTLRIDGQGNFSAVKNTGPQYGQEVIWTDGWLYPRLRYAPFLRRRPRNRSEVRAIEDRMYGLLPGYVGLLGRFISVTRVKEAQLAGRKVVKIRLGLLNNAAPAPPARGQADRWRRFIAARSISGTALLCAKTGVPLEVELKASWSFHPPDESRPRTGIPAKVDQRAVGQMKIGFRQQIADIGAKASIKPPDPANTRVSSRRVRLELERQMLTGERPVAGRVDEDEDDDGE